MRVLIVEDERELADFLRAHLPKRGFVTDVAYDGTSAIGLIRTNEYDLIVLDLNLPDMQGEEVVREILLGKQVPPILMLTVVADAESKVRLLTAGADDYLTKPFSFDELVARMRALLRRSHERIPNQSSVGELTLDATKQTITRSGRPIPLTHKEFTLLEYLMRHNGILVPKSKLIEHAWDATANPFSNALETHMTNLRRKLGDPDPISTVHGRGYVIHG